jgi:hypothetical protein
MEYDRLKSLFVYKISGEKKTLQNQDLYHQFVESIYRIIAFWKTINVESSISYPTIVLSSSHQCCYHLNL